MSYSKSGDIFGDPISLEPFDLPEGYRLDVLGDPGFAAAGATPEAIEREALDDLAANDLPTAS